MRALLDFVADMLVSGIWTTRRFEISFLTTLEKYLDFQKAVAALHPPSPLVAIIC